jgi:hypothetical protein
MILFSFFFDLPAASYGWMNERHGCAFFQAAMQNLPGETEPWARHPGQDLNISPPKYDTGVLTTTL